MRFRVGAILAALALLAVASPTYAQGIVFGVKAGVNFANVSFDDVEQDEEEFVDQLGNKTGFIVGGFVEVPLGPQFAFAPEVLYTQKGSKAEFDGPQFNEFDGATFTQSLQQVQIPVLFKANFSGGPVKPFVVAGPAFGFNTSVESKTEGTPEDDGEVDQSESTKGIEYSLVFGGGVKFGQASVEVRYDLGLNNLNDFPEGSEESDGGVKTRTWSILFGFGWGS